MAHGSTRLLGVVLVVATLAAGCGGGGGSSLTVTLHATPSGESAAVFITRILREEINGQWSRQWSELHPGHQKLITRGEYVACSKSMGTNFATGREIFHVLDVSDEAIDVRGIPQRSSKLVTISFHQPGKANGLTYRLHAVRNAGRWTWILGGRFLTAVEHGLCLDGKPLRSTA